MRRMSHQLCTTRSGAAAPNVVRATIRRLRAAAVAAVAMACLLALACLPARADVFDCVAGVAKTTLDPGKIKDAAEFQLKYGQCTAHMANPTPSFAAALAIVGAAMASGVLPKNAEACIGAVPNAAAKLMLAAIDAMGISVPASLKSDLNSTVQSQADDAYNKILNQFPALAAIAGMFNCACAVDAFAKDALDDFVNTAKTCGKVLTDLTNLIGDWGEAIGDGLSDFGCAIGSAVGACSFGGSVTQCEHATCSMGQQCYAWKVNTSEFKIPFSPNDNCGPCGQIAGAVPLEAGLCGCSANFKSTYKKWTGKFLLASCTCPAPYSLLHSLQSDGTITCGCPKGQVLKDGQCQTVCAPNEQAAWKSQTVEIAGASLSQTEWFCTPCSAGTKSDGQGPCIPCASDNAFVANGVCTTCKRWQKVHLSMNPAASHCEPICSNGVWVDPSAPGASKIPKGLPVTASPQFPGLSNPQSPKPVSTSQVAKAATQNLNPSGAPKGSAVAKLVLAPYCLPCGPNEYSADNQCHACGRKAVVNVAAGSCTPCAGREVAKLINSTMICAADCSQPEGMRGRRPTTGTITDPNAPSQCIACAAGTHPNETHTACVSRGHLSQPKKPPPQTTERKKSNAGRTTAGIACPPGMHPNARGTGCAPDLDRPDLRRTGRGPSPTGGGGLLDRTNTGLLPSPMGGGGPIGRTGTPALMRGR